MRRDRRRGWRVTRAGWGSFALVAMVAGVGVAHDVVVRHPQRSASAAQRAAPVVRPGARPLAQTAPRPAAAAIPGLGPDFAARIPAATTQVVLASGQGPDASTGTVTLWSRDAAGRWHAGASWPAHNALRGWTAAHHLDDLRSPIGVFGLTDTGGLDPDPSTRMPYTRSTAFTAIGTGFEGEPLAGAFDYVVAINYNHVAGSSPLDQRRPLGADRGGGIWLHVDHGGPTHGCVSLARADMVALLRWLDPAAHPVIVMGDAADLAR
jgi:L,D-peptidoglycan transpeptidase YkuD (ErfK/YbiS/YcfS/YnhG family)